VDDGGKGAGDQTGSIRGGITWVWPLPRMPVTTRDKDYSIFSRESKKNLYLSLESWEGATPKVYPKPTNPYKWPGG